MTFSIVAWDPDGPSGPEWGVAVASKFLAAAAVVSWAKAGAGAVATQALANVSYGPEGLGLLATGYEAQKVIDSLTRVDDGRADRQVGIVDGHGGSASFTGEKCFEWAGGRIGDGYAVQGNILSGPDVVDAMAEAFESSDGDFPRRLLGVLAAGDAAGGDRRGKQSAGLLVVREGGGYGGGTDIVIDLRVDDHREPVAELERLLGIHELLFPRPGTMEFVEIDDPLADELRTLLRRRGYDADQGTGYDQALRDVLFTFVGIENLEERWVEEPKIEVEVLAVLRRT